MIRARSIVFLLTLILLLQSVQPAISAPKDWSDNDAVKFIMSAVQVAIGEATGAALQAAGHAGALTTPVMDIYSAVDALAGSSKTMMSLALHQKMQKAILDGDMDKANRLQAYETALSTGDNARLTELLKQGINKQKPVFKPFWVIDLNVPPVQQADKVIQGSAVISTPQRLPGALSVDVRFSLHTLNDPNEIAHIDRTIPMPANDKQFTVRVDSLNLKLPSTGQWRLVVLAKADGYEPAATQAPITAGSVVIESATATPAPTGRPVQLDMRFRLEGGKGNVVVGGFLQSVPDADDPTIHRHTLTDKRMEADNFPTFYQESWPATNLGGKYEWHYSVKSTDRGEATGIIPFTLPKVQKSDIIVESAVALPNPQIEGFPMSLDVKFHTRGDLEEVEYKGYVESADGNYRHTIDAQNLRILEEDTGEFPVAKHTFTPPTAGTYTWHYQLSSGSRHRESGDVKLEVKVRQVAKTFDIKSQQVINAEGFVGDTFTLRVVYALGGLGGVVDAAETSEIVGQSVGTVSFPPQTRRINHLDKQIVKEITYKSTTPGVFDWRYAIDIPEFGGRQGTLSFIVKPRSPVANLKLDSADVTKIGKPGDTITMRVRYHIDGFSPTDSVEVQEGESRISGPIATGFGSRKVKVVGSGIIEKTLTIVPTAEGDYDWFYEIDAGQYGKIDNNANPLHFKIKDNRIRRIELVGASVQPSSAPTGSTHVLRVTYRLVGMGTGESITVSENDKIAGWKTQYNETSNVVANSDRNTLTKVAAYTSLSAGSHIWHFSMDAPGFESVYGSVPFNVTDVAPKPQLSARLDYSMITLAPGETKNCSVHISGYRGNTADRVEIIYPQIMDGWGTLPGQIQVFPGNTSMDPYNMRGAGDYTKSYASGHGYRARETAPPGITAVKIIVRQKDAGQVTLTLLVKVVPRGQTTTGTENPLFPPDGTSGGTGTGGTGTGGTGTGGTGTGGTGTGGTGTGGTGTGGAGTGETGTGGTGTGGTGTGGTGTGGTGTGGTTGGTGTGGTGTGGSDPADKTTVKYYFKKAVVLLDSPGVPSQVTEFTTTNFSVPIAWSESDPGKAGIAKQDVKGSVTYVFPPEITLHSYQSDPTTYLGNPTINVVADAQFTRSGRSSGFSAGPVGIFVGEQQHDVYRDATKKDARSNFSSGSQSFSLKWTTEPQAVERASFAGGEPAHQPSLEVTTGETAVYIGGKDIAFTGRRIYPYKVEYTLEPGEKAAAPTDEITAVKLIAKLEKSKIILEAGRLPSISNAILIENWNRDTAEPIEVIFSGQGFLNSLPNDMHVMPGSGSQSPDALSRLSSDKGTYRWPQGFDAAQGAKPGVYRVPITVQQKKGGVVPLILDVQIIPSTSKLGNLTSVFNAVPKVGDPGIAKAPKTPGTTTGATTPPKTPGTTTGATTPPKTPGTTTGVTTPPNAPGTTAGVTTPPNTPTGVVTKPPTVWGPGGFTPTTVPPVQGPTIVHVGPGPTTANPGSTGWGGFTPTTVPTSGIGSGPTVVGVMPPKPPVSKPPVFKPPVYKPPTTPQSGTGSGTTSGGPHTGGWPGPSTVTQPAVPTSGGYGSAMNLSGKWYGGSGGVNVSHNGGSIVISTYDSEYPTTWQGTISGNTMQGTWSCPRINQKGSFTFTYNPNYQKGYMERISGTYYIESQWGNDPRDFYADRKVTAK